MSEKSKTEGGTKTLPREKVEKPEMWKVVFHNDDYTTMEFVVWALMTIFKHTLASATRIMLHVHKTGIGIAGVYTKEVAETKVQRTLDSAREAGYPLMVSMEPE
jgi:ATP-dependent Clp protease adaptor protein ClpS